MHRLLIALLLLPGAALAEERYTIERTPQEGDTLVILFGRACRAATDQNWMEICTAALNQARKELEARKPKPAPETRSEDK